jgi:chemotaxis protein MotA
MIPLAGILIVFGAVLGGFVMAGGKPGQLAQPAELIIIAGSALGAMMVANSPARLLKTAGAVGQIFRAPAYTREKYLSMLQMLYAVFHLARRKGGQALEDAVDDPLASPLFRKFSESATNRDALEFVCDTLRMCALGSISPVSLDAMLENELEVRRHEVSRPVEILASLADALPGFGIVAAVLGVILSMGAIREPPLKVGLKIASALIGTFTGILLAYGVVSPISARLAKIEDAESDYFDCMRAALASFVRGMPPSIAVECARRAIPPEVRPDFEAVERVCRRVDHPIRSIPE